VSAHLLGPFADLPAAERDALTRATVTRTFPAGGLIWSRGDRADHLLVIQSGMVAIEASNLPPPRLSSRPGDSGAESTEFRGLILAVMGAESVIGEMALAGVPRRSASVVAWTDTVAASVPTELLIAMRQGDPGVDAVVMGILADTVRRLTNQVIETTFVPQAVRLRRILLRLARLGDSATITVTQAQLAEILGARRTTVSALLAADTAAGHIESGRGHIRIVNERALRAASLQ
jgi:CRP/FNR family cyclic AMP-dependent transcriptional regulator